MVDVNLDSMESQVGSEIRMLAESMLHELEQGELSKAVALVNDLNEVRDRTLFNEIGKLTRALHEAIKNLNVDSVGAASDIEHTTDKLAYVLEMTDKSANRTMDLVDEGMPLADQMVQQASDLSSRWKKFMGKELTPAEFRQLTKDVDVYLKDNARDARLIQGKLSEIVLAQDFQDLTGQVIHKVADLIRDVEQRLVTLVAMAGHVDRITGIQHYVESAMEKRVEEPDIKAEGPQINKANADVVASQDDVDDLLSSLGF